MREVVSYNDTSVAARRLLELSLQVLPDFERFNVAARLAASEAVDWQTVAQAWSYYGLYAGGFLVLTWVLFARREL
jgi:hypothetical protein